MSPTSRLLLTATAFASAAAWTWWEEPPRHRLVSRDHGNGRRIRPPASWLVAGAGVVLAVVAGAPVLAVLAPPLGLFGRSVLAARSRAKRVADTRAAVATLCATLAVELRAGRTPLEALTRAGDEAPAGPAATVLAGPVAAARSHGDLVGALLSAAEIEGAAALRRLAACWRVSESSGAGLALAVDRVADGLRAEETQRREVAAELAAPRATARLLAVLPLAGLLLGAGIGAHPLAVLLHTPYGLACLVLGAALDVAGLAWTARIARSAEQVAPA